MTDFLLTWKPEGWPHENIVKMEAEFRINGTTGESWRIFAHKMAKPGDGVWVLKQGRGSKGIFATGNVVGLPFKENSGPGKQPWRVPVRFSAFVDPLESLLIGEQEVRRILRPAQIKAQASGYPLDEDQAERFRAWTQSSEPTEVGGEGDWTRKEVKTIVDDYFEMLDADINGEPYSKTERNEILRRTIRRTEHAIERKRANIGTVLEILGLRNIRGYKGQTHFQNALVDEVRARVESDPARFEKPILPMLPTPEAASNFLVQPPANQPRYKGRSIVRLISEFDRAARDAANRSLGKEGEAFVFEFERRKLLLAGRKDLSDLADLVSQSVGDGLGFDVQSFEDNGDLIFIEVKTTNGPIGTPFMLSENERQVAAEKGPSYRLYRLFDFSDKPRIYVLRGPLDLCLTLDPINYRARVVAGQDPSPAKDS